MDQRLNSTRRLQYGKKNEKPYQFQTVYSEMSGPQVQKSISKFTTRLPTSLTANGTLRTVCDESVTSFGDMSSYGAANESAVVGRRVSEKSERRSSSLWKFIFFFFPKPNLWGSSLHTDNFPSSIKAIELNKQRALMNLQLGWCRQRERVCMRDPYLYMLVNASTHLYVCMSACIYVRCSDRGSPLRYLGWASSSLSSITRGKWNTFVSDCCIGREREGEGEREREGRGAR